MEEQVPTPILAGDTAGSDVDLSEALRGKRKTRGQRACYPCRHRKVRCSYEQPCKTCLDRGHPELCRYQAAPKRSKPSSTVDSLPTLSNHPSPPASDWNKVWNKFEKVQQSILELQEELKHVAAGTVVAAQPGKKPRLEEWMDAGSVSRAADTNFQLMQPDDDPTGEMAYDRPISVPALIMSLEKGREEETIGKLVGRTALPVFGLDNESATYPFVGLWSMSAGSAERIQELCKLLPTNGACLQTFCHYRDTAHVLFPGLVDIETFESELGQFLMQRANAPPGAGHFTEENVYGQNIHWLGLLFATLASGSQCLAMPNKEGQLTSQVYGE